MTIAKKLERLFISKEIKVLLKNGDDFILARRYIIATLNNGITIPHPISDFIDKKYYLESGSINSEKAAANVVTQFLNYVFTQVKKKSSNFMHVNGIKDLELSHLESYLEFCGENFNNRNTVEMKEKYLLNLYYFLSVEKKQLKTTPDFELINTNNNRGNNESWNNQSIHANLSYKKPPKDVFDSLSVKKKDIITQSQVSFYNKNETRLMMLREFLLLAEKEVPDVAFAMALQAFAGLRSAECMNLTMNSIIKSDHSTKYGENGLIIQVRDRQIELFPTASSTTNNQVKTERDQAVLLNPLIPYLYKKHLKWLSIKRKKLKNKSFRSNIALFLNNNGDPMQTHTYRDRFKKLKKTFLSILKYTQGRYDDYVEFKQTNWSTHILRGVFTNLCVDSGYNETQTAILRGDKSAEAMFDYFDIISSSRKISMAIDVITDESIEELEKLSEAGSFFNTTNKEGAT